MKIIQLSTIAVALVSMLVLASFNFASAYSNVSELNVPSFNKLFKFSKLVCGESICTDQSSFHIKYDKSMKEEEIKTQKKSASNKNSIEFMKLYYRI